MDTRFLESFLIAAESGSVAEAARRLNLTPATVAQRIRALEAEMSVRLLTRTGRTARPTAAGHKILVRAHQLLRDARDLRTIASDETLTGQLRIGAISTALSGILPAALSTLSASCPQLNIHVIPGTSMSLYRMVLNGELDAAILVQPPFELPKVCNWMLLREEPLVVIAPASGFILNPRALLTTEPFIRYDRNHWGGRLADTYLQKAKILPRERFELDALDAIAVMVNRGLGVALVPDWAPPWPAGLALHKLAVHAPSLMRRIGMLWMRNCVSIRLVQAFRLQLRGALGI